MKITKELKLKDKAWTEAVKARDNHQCIICYNSARLNAHHILPKRLKITRHDVRNGISLCPLHHKLDMKLSAHKNPLAFFKWMQLNRYEQINYLLSLCNLNMI